MDGGAARRIARLALEDAPPQTRVVEIGAGTGALTRALVEEGAHVSALEIDSELVSILNERDLGAEIVHADALAYDFAAFASLGAWRVTGNLPYNVATPLIVGLCEMHGAPDSITVMVQKDVADRLAARPGVAAYGSLSIAVQYGMDVSKAFTLGPRSFYPAPKVDSTVVRMVRRAEPAVHPRDVALFRRVVRAAFAYRRKTLANSLVLSLGLPRQTVASALTASSLDERVRGEQLSMAEFARLADNL